MTSFAIILDMKLKNLRQIEKKAYMRKGILPQVRYSM